MTFLRNLFRRRPPAPRTLISQETAEKLKAVHMFHAGNYRRLG